MAVSGAKLSRQAYLDREDAVVNAIDSGANVEELDEMERKWEAVKGKGKSVPVRAHVLDLIFDYLRRVQDIEQQRDDPYFLEFELDGALMHLGKLLDTFLQLHPAAFSHDRVIEILTAAASNVAQRLPDLYLDQCAYLSQPHLDDIASFEHPIVATVQTFLGKPTAKKLATEIQDTVNELKTLPRCRQQRRRVVGSARQEEEQVKGSEGGREEQREDIMQLISSVGNELRSNTPPDNDLRGALFNVLENILRSILPPENLDVVQRLLQQLSDENLSNNGKESIGGQHFAERVGDILGQTTIPKKLITQIVRPLNASGARPRSRAPRKKAKEGGKRRRKQSSSRGSGSESD